MGFLNLENELTKPDSNFLDFYCLYVLVQIDSVARQQRIKIVVASTRASSWLKNDIPKETAAPNIPRIKFVIEEAEPAIPGKGCRALATLFGFTKASPKIKTHMGKMIA